MGNCMHPEPNYQFEPSKVQNGNSSLADDGRQVSLIARLETVEGTLFLYRSIVVRNFLHIQGEVDKLIAKGKPAEAAFTLKRQKLFEILLKKIEEQMQGVREAMDNAEAKKKKKESLKTLSITYLLIEDIDELNKLEDALSSSKREDELLKASFQTLFDKFGIKDEDIKQEIDTLEPPFNGIDLCESFCVQKSAIPNFKSSSDLPNMMIMARFSSVQSLMIQNCASNNSLPNFASNTEIQVPVALGS